MNIRRKLSPQLSEIERQAKQGIIQERIWLAAFQYISYPCGRDQLDKYMLPETRLELQKLGVLTCPKQS